MSVILRINQVLKFSNNYFINLKYLIYIVLNIFDIDKKIK